MNLDIKEAINSVKELFKNLCIDIPEETPYRFVKMLEYMTSYSNISNTEIAEEVNKIFPINTSVDLKEMVVVRDIDAFSWCEHHIALIYDMKVSIGYIPENFVLGLSKIVRVVDMVCKRLQLQEKIASDIVDVMEILTKSKNVAVHIRAKHSCMTARGIQNASAETVTTCYSGVFKDDKMLRAEFLNNIS